MFQWLKSVFSSFKPVREENPYARLSAELATYRLTGTPPSLLVYEVERLNASGRTRRDRVESLRYLCRVMTNPFNVSTDDTTPGVYEWVLDHVSANIRTLLTVDVKRTRATLDAEAATLNAEAAAESERHRAVTLELYLAKGE